MSYTKLLSIHTMRGNLFYPTWGEKEKNKTCVINDPLGQTHCLTSSGHYFQATFVCFVLEYLEKYVRKHVRK